MSKTPATLLKAKSDLAWARWWVDQTKDAHMRAKEQLKKAKADVAAARN